MLSSTLVRPCTAFYVISVRRFGSLPASIFFADIRLPSDSISRWTPLPSANAFLLYLIIFVLICFFLPVIFTPQSKNTAKTIENEEENKNIEIEQVTKSTYDYKNYKEITLYHTSTKKTEKVPLDEYLYGVVSAEMPASFEEEALKAQAVVARTYTLYKIQNSKRKT